MGEVANGIGEGSRGIDDNLGLRREPLARFEDMRRYILNAAIGVFRQTRNLHVIQHGRALLDRGGDQVDEQASVIELPVEINHTAAQAIGIDARQVPEGFGSGSRLEGPKAYLPDRRWYSLRPRL